MNRPPSPPPVAPSPTAAPTSNPWIMAEMLGIDGPFTFSERLLQKIWMRGDFDRASMQSADGRAVQVVHPGRWNLLAGPDFRDARLVIGGSEVQGDVELHINADDWRLHGHADDPAYDGVVLHAVLFPPGDAFTRGAGGRLLPVVALLPLLRQDLEAYATEEALETLVGRSVTELRTSLENAPELAVPDSVLAQAGLRWRQKVHFARCRIERLGWEAACHHAALEVLGYRMNRAPMLSVAAEFPLARWQWRPGANMPTQERVADEAWESQRGRWRHRGVRPPNYPRLRLRQYARWMAAAPDWPARLQNMLPDLMRAARAASQVMSAANAGGYASVGEARRRVRLKEVRVLLARTLGAEALGPGSTRLDTFLCDAVFPLVAAMNGETAGDDGTALEWLWQAWLPGDHPEEFAACIKELGLTNRGAPLCHGMIQGMLGWLLQRSPVFRTGDK
ncbi:DUF2851 family protein [Opitutaceae bacterium TAV4]|nr:DUF2851 family protein [Opitutaceae bacterium TAV4]